MPEIAPWAQSFILGGLSWMFIQTGFAEARERRYGLQALFSAASIVTLWLLLMVLEQLETAGAWSLVMNFVELLITVAELCCGLVVILALLHCIWPPEPSGG